MRLPRWFPQVPRPWNPAFQATWDAMSPNEKRWSALVDILTVGGVIATLCLLAACQQAPRTAAERAEADRARCDAATMPETHCERLRDTSPPPGGDAPVYVDPATGCQYLGYTGHGLTPRMQPSRSNTGPTEVQMGCRR